MNTLVDIVRSIFKWLEEHSPLQIIPETESGVRWRLGVMHESKSGGVMFMVPFMETIDRVDITTGAFTFTPQLMMTIDGHTISAQLGVTYHVQDSKKLLMHLGCNDTQEVVAVIGRGLLVRHIWENTLESIIKSRSDIETSLYHELNDRLEQYGLECDTVHILETGKTRGIRLIQ